jgi:single-stranded-DNA-specific exonuclease
MIDKHNHFPSLSVSSKKWVLRTADPRLVLALAQTLGESELVARLLAIRGVNLDTVHQFLNPTLRAQMPDPCHLKDMDKAINRLIQAIKNREKICFYGDYDVDGATSTSLMLSYFRDLNVEASFYIPDRISEGYGPNVAAFQKLAADGIKVIVTLDCGTTSFEPIAAAQQAGVDVIVIDHHTAEPRLPNALAVINPNRLDEQSPCGMLAAVGVSFLVLVGLNQRLRQQGYFANRPEPNLLAYLDLVALGTVCDVMPLTGLNRAFVSQGLKILGKRQRIGLRALCDIGGLNAAPAAYHLGFILGPRINAAGRISCADYGTRLLTSNDEHEAQRLARMLDQFNEERQLIEQQVLEEAYLQAAQQEEAPLIIVHGEGWHPGVIGIVAGRVKERFHRPTLAISFDEQLQGKGSGRSIVGIDLGSLIHAARQKGLLTAGGGHAMAAGFSLEKAMLTDFQQFMVERILASGCDLTPSSSFDGYLAASALSVEFIEKLARLEPYGQGNPSPKFVIENLRIATAEIVGSNHVRVVLRSADGHKFKGIAFRAVGTPLGDTLLAPKPHPIHVLGAVKIDRWNGNMTINIEIDDIALAAPSSQALF